jgi:hypothetical protein
MTSITLWYAKLSRKARIALLCGGIGLVLVIAVLVAYMTMVPAKVQVRTGTIVLDPIDGHVWQDDTQTLMVDPSEAANYHVEYVDQLSPEHQAQVDAEKQAAQEQRQKLENSQGVEALTTAIPAQTMTDLHTMQGNLDTMSQEAISGLQIANEVDKTRTSLTQFRNQLAATPVPAELENLKKQAISLLDMGIQACTLTLQYIGTGDQTILKQAQDLAQQAADEWQKLIAPYASSATSP